MIGSGRGAQRTREVSIFVVILKPSLDVVANLASYLYRLMISLHLASMFFRVWQSIIFSVGMRQTPIKKKNINLQVCHSGEVE